MEVRRFAEVDQWPGGDMVIVWVIAGVLAVLLGIGAVLDQRSRRVRQRVGRVHVPGGPLTRNTEAVTGAQLTQYDAGQSMAHYVRERDEEPHRAD